jgi:hypothetical protein
MDWKRLLMTAALAVIVGACDDAASTPTSPDDAYQSPLVHETFSGTLTALTSTACSPAFVRSVHPSYYQQGTGRCVEFRATSTTAGIVKAVLSWPERHLDLDLVLNDGVGSNFAQGIGGNKGSERIESFVNAGTTYAFIVHLQGVDALFLANGGRFPGEVTTPFTIEIERPR